MSYTVKYKNYEEQDRRKSALITFLVSLTVLLGIFFYKFTKIIEKPQEITTMLINFGDNRDGNESLEPAEQPGSMASITDVSQTEAVQQNTAATEAVSQPSQPATRERVITGTNTKNTAVKAEKNKKTAAKPVAAKTSNTKTASSKATTANASSGQGDGKGTAAVGNLIRGRGNRTGTQGTSGTTGNAGDPLGGDANGDSKIGVDRKLIGFIPGTMGRGGAHPSHNCSASGTISIAYTVDQAGNVTSASRSGGISDGCVVSTSISWVKKYVKAERANTRSTGTYSITF